MIQGGAAHQSAINTIAYKGRLLLIGFAGGSWPVIDPFHMLFKGYAVMGAVHPTRTEEEKLDAIEKLAEMVVSGKINPPKAKLFDFANAVEAVSEVGSLGSIGGIAVKVFREDIE